MLSDMPAFHDLLTAREAAAALGVPHNTLNRWARNGRIAEHLKHPGLRGPRLFERAEVERLLAERKPA